MRARQEGTMRDPRTIRDDLGVRSACDKVRQPAVRTRFSRSLTATGYMSGSRAFPQVNAVRILWSGAGSNRRPSAFQADARTN